MQIQITHVVPSATPEKTQTYRLTVRQASYVDRTHYFALCREGMEQYEKRFGFPIDDDTDEPESRGLRNLTYYRAEMLCVIDRERTAEGILYMGDFKNGSPDAQWERKPLPSEWLTLDGMAEKMPPALTDAWLDATRQLNAGVLNTIPESFLAVGGTTVSVID